MTILVVYWYPLGQTMRPAVAAHLRALDGGPERIAYYNAAEGPAPWLRALEPDAVLLHTTALCLRWAVDFERHRRRLRWLSRLECPKLAFPQDEYDHSDVLDEWLAELGVSHVYSNFGAEQRPPLYPTLAGEVEFRSALTGYVDEHAAARLADDLPAIRDREVDVVYRATKLPYWFGSHGQLKHTLGTAVAERAAAHGLRVDISTRVEDTILGDAWWSFMRSGRVTIGCESGSSVLDRHGAVQATIRRLLARDPGLGFDEVSRQMPAGWDDWRFFAISPRHLEAVITKTCQVLVEGSYSGILEPHRHYIPLKRDLTNLDEVLETIRDPELLEQVAEQAYRDVYLSGRYTYDAFAAAIRDDLRQAGTQPERKRGRDVAVLGLAAAASGSRVAAARVGRTRAGRAGRQAVAVARLAANPGPTLQKAGVATTAVARNRHLRRLLRSSFSVDGGEPRPGIVSLLGDVVAVERLRAAVSGGERAAIAVEGADEPAVRISTSPPGEPAAGVEDDSLRAALSGSVGSITWARDGADGPVVHRFDALAALARRRPEDVQFVLADALRGGRPANGAD